MAKKKSKGPSKSGAVRDYLSVNPDATASVVIPELAQRGVNVSPALVNQIKTRMKRSGDLSGPAGATGQPVGKKTSRKKSVKKKARGRTSAKQSATLSGTASNSLTADELVETKKLVDELGGIDRARKALEYLEDLG